MKLQQLVESEEERRKETYAKWRELVNMGPKELASWKERQVELGKKDPSKHPGLKRPQAAKLGIKSGTQSAEWIIKMKSTPVSEWTPEMWRWASRQISFISRMRGNSGPLRDDEGQPTRKLLSLKIWGHDPEK